ncbi:MAG: hypothetical protein KDC38_16330 [Planctomycetes bacterium]|nr:hypothetical protein [Planctomycetota bacterium]
MRSWIALLVPATLCVSCFSSPPKPLGPTAEQIELQNVKTSLEMVRSALAEMADDRDRFQDLYLSSSQELTQSKDDLEFLESQARHQLSLVQNSESRVQELQAQVATLDRELGQAKSSGQEVQSRVSVVEERLTSVETERDELKKQLTDTQTELAESQRSATTLEKQGESLRAKLATIQGENRNDQESAQEALESTSLTVRQLQAELEQLRPMRDEVSRLEHALQETEQAKKEEVERRLEVERAKSGADTVGFDQVKSYFTALAVRSFEKAKTGEFDQESLTFLGSILSVVVLALFFLVGRWKGRRVRRRARELEARLERAEDEVRSLRTQRSNVPTPRRTISAPPELVRSAAMARASSPQFSAPGFDEPTAPLPSHVPEPALPPEEMTQMLTPLSEESFRTPSSVPSLGGAFDLSETAVTEDLSEAVRAVRQQKQSAPSDDDLLRDLQQVIDQKLSNDR